MTGQIMDEISLGWIGEENFWRVRGYILVSKLERKISGRTDPGGGYLRFWSAMMGD